MDVEAIRARYRPERITTLFMGESAPASGKFFYHGDTAMMRNMKRVLKEAELYKEGDFFEWLQRQGWFLDDLVLTPVNAMDRLDRLAKCEASVPHLADRLREYHPQAVVTLMKGIKPYVDAAMAVAGCTVPHHALPFPGQGRQGQFRSQMLALAQQLPRLPQADRRP
jgi:hypothetical protein